MESYFAGNKLCSWLALFDFALHYFYSGLDGVVNMDITTRWRPLHCTGSAMHIRQFLARLKLTTV